MKRAITYVATFMGLGLILSACSGSSTSSDSQTVDREAGSAETYMTLTNELDAWWTGSGIPITWKVSKTENNMWDGNSRPDHTPPDGFQGLVQESPSSYTARMEQNSSSSVIPSFHLTPALTFDGQQIELFPLRVIADGYGKYLSVQLVGSGGYVDFCNKIASARQFSEKTPRGYVEYQYDINCGTKVTVAVRNIARNR